MSCFPCFPAAGASSSAVHPVSAPAGAAASHSTSAAAATAPLSSPAAVDLHGYEAAFPAAELPERGLKQHVLKANGAALCIVSADGQLRAISDLCPHKQGVMSQGDIEDADKALGLCVKCPRHRKKIPGGLNFRVSDGGAWVADASACEIAFDPSWRVDVHDVRVVGGTVYVAVAPANAPQSSAAATAAAPPAPVVAAAGPATGGAPGARGGGGGGGGSRKGSGASSTAGAADPRAVMAMLSIMATGVDSSSTDSSAAPSEAAPPSPIVEEALRPLDLSRYERVCALSELPPSGLRRHVLKRSGDAVCVVSHAGRSQLRAVGDVCPHKKAQMSLGDIEDADRGRCGGLSVTCPKHRKRFRQRGLHFSCDDGAAWVTDPAACTEPVKPGWVLPVYDVVVADGAVYVSAAPRPAKAAAAATGPSSHSQAELARDVAGGAFTTAAPRQHRRRQQQQQGRYHRHTDAGRHCRRGRADGVAAVRHCGRGARERRHADLRGRARAGRGRAADAAECGPALVAR
jgi:nitrite reductase/ring-hydroxylating ferredoxin subunit